MTKFSDFFKDYMQNHNCSQRMLATRLGVSRRTIGRWVSGEAYPVSADRIEDIVEKLSLTREEKSRLYHMFYAAEQRESYRLLTNVLHRIRNFQIVKNAINTCGGGVKTVFI